MNKVQAIELNIKYVINEYLNYPKGVYTELETASVGGAVFSRQEMALVSKMCVYFRFLLPVFFPSHKNATKNNQIREQVKQVSQ